ncbi:hypothetical protein D1007_47649 [Hordeum vulgare]|nr:hypothetical protein D1007_47649 [Hordeum vulgare]
MWRSARPGSLNSLCSPPIALFCSPPVTLFPSPRSVPLPRFVLRGVHGERRLIARLSDKHYGRVESDGGVDGIYVEYNGEEDEREETDSGSDFEDELDEVMNLGSEGEPDAVITAEEPGVIITAQEPDHILNAIEQRGAAGEILEHILVLDVGGVIIQVISSPVKQNVRVAYPSQSSQVVHPTQLVVEGAQDIADVSQNGSDSEESEDYDKHGQMHLQARLQQLELQSQQNFKLQQVAYHLLAQYIFAAVK